MWRQAFPLKTASGSAPSRGLLTMLVAHVTATMMEQLKALQKSTREPGLAGLLIVEALLVLIALPLETHDQLPGAMLRLLGWAFLVASFFVALQSYLAVIAFAASIMANQIAMLIYVGPHSSILAVSCDAAARHTALCAVSWVVAKIVFAPGRINVYRIEAAVVLFLNIALFFFTTYRFLVTVVPGALLGLADSSHSMAELLYFSLSTLVGFSYRGITPDGFLASHLVTVESIVGLLYPAAIVVRFLTLQMRA